MEPSFETVITPKRVDETRFAAEVLDGWQQGRGAFGGVVLGLVVRSVEESAAGPDRRLRTLTAEICAPVLVGPVDIVVEPLRIGSGTSTVAARVLQGGEVVAHAVVVLGRERAASPSWLGVARPTPAPWRDVLALPPGFAAPVFTQHFEYRLTGSPPFSGGAAQAEGWVRPRNPGAARDAAYTVALADAWWPALFGLLEAPRPIATITFTLDLLSTLDGLDPEAPLYHQSTTLVSADGYAPELRTLWGEDGRLVAINHQTFVVIR